METIKERIKALASSRNMGLPKLEEALGFGNGTIVKWENSSPSVEKLQKVADYFDVSLDYLTGRDEVNDEDVWETRERLRNQPGMRMLFDATSNATSSELEAVANMFKAMKGNHDE